MAKLTKNEVLHIAKLGKLELSVSEVEKFSDQLSDILKYVEQLNEVDTKGVEPTAQVTGLSNVMAEDKIERSDIGYQAIKKNAPDFENGSFKVPAVFDSK